MNKKFHYIRIKEEQSPKKASKKRQKILKNVGNALTIVGTTISSMLLILVIMVCIVVTVVTVYILDFADNGFDADLKEAEMDFVSFIYAYDSDGQEVEVRRITSGENRIWVDYEEISPNIVYAVVATEDKRFWEHKGVDWGRTVYALSADVLNLSGKGQGGSTITQQLIKNITDDDGISWERKLREIFRALSLEEKYTKIDILESYLNRIPYSNNVYGVAAAAQYYFGKDVSEIDIAEAAILAGIIKSPHTRSPYSDLAACKERQETALYNLYEQGYITLKEYEEARIEQVQFAKVVFGDAFGYVDPRSLETSPDDIEDEDPEDDENYNEAYKWNEYQVTQNWYVDAAIRQICEDYAELKGITFTSARNEIYGGGYKMYINMDIEMQNALEEKFRNPKIAVASYDPNAKSEDLLQAACVIMDYTGTVLALAGGLGDKPGNDCFNRATMAIRAPGSTIKPIAVYSTAVQKNLITYSTYIPDKKIPRPDDDNPKKIYYWPDNYGYAGNTGALMPVWEAVRLSRNTVAVRVTQMLTPQACYNQLTQNLGFTTLEKSDIALSPMSFGALTGGVTLMELAASYQIFGNRGVYYEPMLYSRVVDGRGNVILSQDYYGVQAIDSDTSWVTNRMLRTVVTDPTGSGRFTNFGKVEVVGKTGTSNDEKNKVFMGLTPTHVTATWVGYDDGRKIKINHRYCSEIWHDVMVDVEDTTVESKFSADSTVIQRQYCTTTGLLASEDCEKTNVGYYRRSNLPGYCTGDCEYIAEGIINRWQELDEEAAKKVLDGTWSQETPIRY
ncbi:MAG: transglycosylase domain-containing protein [Oscillospiraceae bacterium]|nr:transglycosylase domain-containing protein [Oscillospiraceae bacterium]